MAKQFLLSERRHDVVTVVDSLCGLHAQAVLTPYISLWNRIEDFEPEMLDSALYRERSLVKAWCVRGTLHIIPSRDLPLYHSALERMWFEHHGRYTQSPEWPSQEERQRMFYPKILQALADRPLRRKELNERVLSTLADTPKSYQRLFSGWGGILKETCYLGLTVHAEPCGNEACFARLDQWLPQVNLDEIREDEARRKLLIKYLHGYGPASAQDFTYWSGLLAGETRKAIEGNKPGLKDVQVKGSGKRLLMLKEDLRELEKLDLEERHRPCLLPKFDPFLLGHKDRSRMIKEEFVREVYRKAGDLAAVALVNGHIVGTWKAKKTRKKLAVILESLEKIGKEDLTELKQVVKDLGAFMNVEQTEMLLDWQTA
jgi:hypothetical protein